jgi:hypothetical protein
VTGRERPYTECWAAKGRTTRGPPARFWFCRVHLPSSLLRIYPSFKDFASASGEGVAISEVGGFRNCQPSPHLFGLSPKIPSCPATTIERKRIFCLGMNNACCGSRSLGYWFRRHNHLMDSKICPLKRFCASFRKIRSASGIQWYCSSSNLVCNPKKRIKSASPPRHSRRMVSRGVPAKRLREGKRRTIAGICCWPVPNTSPLSHQGQRCSHNRVRPVRAGRTRNRTNTQRIRCGLRSRE